MIRITGGTYRSRLLETPSGTLTKPTMDKVRAAVFSALTNDRIYNVLDLFAGSGSYGFEALSRGASHVSFVDSSSVAIKTIINNAKKLGVTSVDVFEKDALDFLNGCNEKFDVIFVDPPYKLEIYQEVVDVILKRDLLNKTGIIVLESERELSLPVETFTKIKLYKYGLAKIYILRK